MGSQTAVEGKQTFKRDLFIGLGQVSVCWNGSDLGTFQSDDAVAIGERVYQAFEEIVDLLDELYDIRGTSIEVLKDHRDKLLAANKTLEDELKVAVNRVKYLTNQKAVVVEIPPSQIEDGDQVIIPVSHNPNHFTIMTIEAKATVDLGDDVEIVYGGVGQESFIRIPRSTPVHVIRLTN